jgi:deoxyhypusine synthase
MDKLSRAHEYVFKRSKSPKGAAVKGYDFDGGMDFERFLDAYGTTGFQATHLGRPIEIVKAMRKENATIILGCTSNIVSSGLRDIITYLIKHRLIHAMVTTAGGIEEDLIKCLKPFLVGAFETDDAALAKDGVNRIGNIFVPNDRYCAFEDWIQPILSRALERQKTAPMTCADLITTLGEAIGDDASYLHWAAAHKIPVFSPGLTDGSLGDQLFFFSQKHPEFRLDIVEDVRRFHQFVINADVVGVIIIGGGLAKAHVNNATMMRGGADFAVYLTTGSAGDGSYAGAPPAEAISWGKIKTAGRHTLIEGDATLTFPLLVAGALRHDA